MNETTIARIEKDENTNPVKFLSKPKQVAKFEMVSFNQFKKDLLNASWWMYVTVSGTTKYSNWNCW